MKGYTKRGEVAKGLYKGGRVCRMVKRTMERLPKGYMKVGEVAKQLHKGGRVAELLYERWRGC
jgi:hypothetical protein